MSVVHDTMDVVAGLTSRTLIGRDAELTELMAELGVDVVPGDRRAVLLAGEAGVGKTRILLELRDRAVASGWQVFAGHCLDFGDSTLAYLPFSELLGQLTSQLPAVVDETLSRHPALARLQPGRRVIGQPDATDAHGVDRSDLFAAVHALLEAAGASAPTVVVVEDLHWADQSTRDLLSFLFTRPFLTPVALVASYRSDDLHRRHPLRPQVAEWARLPGVTRLALSGLPDDDVRTLLSELAPAGLSDGARADIVDRADGNAFFVEELASAATGPGRWVPPDLADVLLVRLDRLDDTARAVVRSASVAGRKVPHELLAAASGLTPDQLDAGIRQAVEMNILVTDGAGYAFRHALLGEAVYDDLLPGERVRLHAQYAAALREGTARGTAAELARHARLATDLDTALAASVQAGREAMVVGGPDEAAYHYQQALELLADPARRAASDLDSSRLVVAAADALTSSGNPDRAVALLTEQLTRLGGELDDTQRARMLSAQANALYITETDLDPVAISAEALLLAPEGESALRARILSVHARILSSWERFDEAQPFAIDALELAERLDLSEIAADATTTLGSLRRVDSKEGLREALAEAVGRAERSGAVSSEFRARFLLGRSHQDWAEFEESERWFRTAIDRSHELGLPWAPWGFESRWQLVLNKYATGDWDEALALTQVDGGGTPPPIPRALLDSVRLLIEQGRGVDVGKRAERLRKFWQREGGIAITSSAVEMVAAGRRGDPRAAIQVYDDTVAVLGRLWREWFSARIRLAAVAAGVVADQLPGVPAAERPALAAEVERLHGDAHVVLDRYTDPSGHWGPEGRAWVKRVDAETLRVRWLAGGDDAPPADVLVEAWREAEQLFADYGHEPELAAVRTVLAGILRALGDTQSSREVADLARETAHRLGAPPLLDRLVVLGRTAVKSDSGASDALTPRETEILGLVSDGLSNGEIAKRLFISAKTVSVHVSNILGKLGAAGRTEAAAIARRRHLLD